MASKFKKKPKIAETEGSGFGEYQEANGGGTPRGGGWGGQSGRVGWEKRKNAGELPEGAHREDQPRTSDGKFTYNSVNGKETKYKSRGETVNPLLTAGENGIKIEDAKEQFRTKSGNIYDKYKGSWYQKGSEKITKIGRKLKTVIALDDVLEIGRRGFDVAKGELKGESEAWSKQGKAGRQTSEELAAQKLARKTGEEQYVKENVTGGIKVKGEGSLDKMYKRLQGTKSADLKHSPAQIKQVRDLLTSNGYDVSAYSDEQIDNIVDEYITIA